MGDRRQMGNGGHRKSGCDSQQEWERIHLPFARERGSGLVLEILSVCVCVRVLPSHFCGSEMTCQQEGLQFSSQLIDSYLLFFSRQLVQPIDFRTQEFVIETQSLSTTFVIRKTIRLSKLRVDDEHTWNLATKLNSRTPAAVIPDGQHH